jgi:Protein of unknown function (DUF2786)
MADSLDRVQKLIALAINNADEEEARSAAMKAISLIVLENMAIGGRLTEGVDASHLRRSWKPDQEFDTFWDEILNHQKGVHLDPEVDPWHYNEGQQRTTRAEGLASTEVVSDLDDAFSAMRHRIKVAWRAIQKERARLKQEIWRWENVSRRRYPRPEPADWEKEE